VTLIRDVVAQGVDRTVQIGGERQRHRHLRERLAAADRRVHDRVGGELVVRDDEPPLFDGADERVGEADLLHHAGLAVVGHPVADPHRLGGGDQQARDEVPERLLRGQADDHAENRGRREQPAGDGTDLGDHEQGGEQPDGDDDRRDRAPQDAVPRLHLRWNRLARVPPVDQAPDSP
jgi:hypothetical protein